VFSRSHASITLSEGGAQASKPTTGLDEWAGAAASKAVMRACRHYALYTAMNDVDGAFMAFGVIRPG
jgi:hypothetical protein